MKILVINGSPKSQYSITLQTVNYLAVLHPEHTFDILHAGHTIKKLENDFSAAKAAMESADLLLFSYPVYTFIAPSQLHRFIELMKESGANLDGKFATQITTSKHFYDITAHRYIADNCKDLGMKYIRGLSADMDDLLTKKGQKDAEAFFDYVCFSMESDLHEPIPGTLPSLVYTPVNASEKPSDVVIVTDCESNNTRLKGMIEKFRAILPKSTRVVNLREYPFSGGCLGCFNCAADGKCIYKDGFDDFLRNKIQTADAIIYAFSVKDHSMGSLFKMYDDRQFCNGHRTVTMGMPIGYLVNGKLSNEENLRTILEARAEVGNNFLCGTACDEFNTNGEIYALAKKLCYALENKYVPPQNFYGVGGMKIFRDLIWLMRGMMKADHKFYKKHGQYDFPQKKRGTALKMYLVGALISNKKIKAKMGNAMNEGMLAPYNKLIEKVRKEK